MEKKTSKRSTATKTTSKAVKQTSSKAASTSVARGLVIRISSQTRFFVFGLAVPTYLAWLGYWLTFTLAKTGSTLKAAADSEQATEIFDWLKGLTGFKQSIIDLIASLGTGTGVVYILLGLLLLVLAAFFARFSFRRQKLEGLELGKISFKSLMNGIVVLLCLVILTQLILELSGTYDLIEYTATLEGYISGGAA